MKVPSCRAICVGELSLWGKQFLSGLMNTKVVEIHAEPSFQKFLEAPTPPEPQVLFFEGTPDSRAQIMKLRQTGRHCFIVWFGRTFTKEDLIFAIDNRVYCVFENTRPDDKKILDSLHRLAMSLDTHAQFEQLVRAIKGVLLASEAEVAKPILNEVKTAIGKIERFGVQNEFSNTVGDFTSTATTNVPFHRAQDFGDALSTVHNLERTGVLWIKGSLAKEEGKIEFLQGKIISAITGDVHGLKAIYRIFLWDNPRFLFTRKDPRESNVAEQLNISMHFICEEGQQLKARYERIRRELPPADLILELEPKSLHINTHLERNEFSTLASVVEFGKVSQVLDYNVLPDVNVFEALIHLRKVNMIRVRM